MTTNHDGATVVIVQRMLAGLVNDGRTDLTDKLLSSGSARQGRSLASVLGIDTSEQMTAAKASGALHRDALSQPRPLRAAPKSSASPDSEKSPGGFPWGPDDSLLIEGGQVFLRRSRRQDHRTGLAGILGVLLRFDVIALPAPAK